VSVARSAWVIGRAALGMSPSRPLQEKATTKPWPHDVQRALPNPKQRMPQVRYDRSSRSTCAETGCSAT
jgi:hypothetical protein